MARITQYDRNEIVKNLMEPKNVSLQASVKKLEGKVTDLLFSMLPKILVTGYEMYPKSFKGQYVGYVFIGDKNYCFGTLKVPNFWQSEEASKIVSAELGDDVLIHITKITETQKFRMQLKCALEHITTENRLKKEFPEAYEALKGVKISEQDPCTDIESVRAQLSTK